MTSFHIDDVIWGKIDDPPRNAKLGVNINRFLSKFQNIFIFVRCVAV